MVAIVQSGGPDPTRSLAFAAFYFLAAIAMVVGSLRCRGQIKWRGGMPASIATQAAFVLMFLIWGACSIGDAWDWSFTREHPVILHFGSMAVVFACLGFDKLRENRSRQMEEIPTGVSENSRSDEKQDQIHQEKKTTQLSIHKLFLPIGLFFLISGVICFIRWQMITGTNDSQEEKRSTSQMGAFLFSAIGAYVLIGYFVNDRNWKAGTLQEKDKIMVNLGNKKLHLAAVLIPYLYFYGFVIAPWLQKQFQLPGIALSFIWLISAAVLMRLVMGKKG